MTGIECERCGEVFDTDRDGVTPGQDTSRCPKCGKSHDEPATDGGETLQVDSEGVTVRITIDIEPT
jgi:predicted  nucleic acid-binding Zn-ribbon protein